MRPFKITFFSWGQEVPGSNPGAPTFHTRISNGLWNPTDTVEGLITVQLLTCLENRVPLADYCQTAARGTRFDSESSISTTKKSPNAQPK